VLNFCAGGSCRAITGAVAGVEGFHCQIWSLSKEFRDGEDLAAKYNLLSAPIIESPLAKYHPSLDEYK
tara:strand:- start:31 stop:234 length:204 start_codon:yes stop_codon:yes gene_type:complete